MAGVVGDAGEFFVASEVSRRRWKCSVIKGNVPSADLMVAHPITKESKIIEVKSFAGTGTSVSWTINKLPEVDNLIYTLVDFKGSFDNHWQTKQYDPPRPVVYILTIDEMRDLWKPNHGIQGSAGVRKSSLKPEYDYREKWSKIFDEDSDIPDGYAEHSPKQLDHYRATKIASKKLTDKGKKKDGSYRKGWDQSKWRAEVNNEIKKIKRKWKKERALE
tara:strand:- start:72 stop:725 length:654 start_codon:yes stop_codon:yes gene_type:complete